jgi:uncharacterized caspase-like protein
MSIIYPWHEHPEEMPRRAVIVGINEYVDKENIPNLKGAEADAREMRDALCNRGGFEVKEHHFLQGPKATCSAIRKAISDLLWASDECYLSLFYFSGHGIVDSYGNLYLATYDIRKNEPFVAGINQDELQQVFFKAKNNKCGLLIFDCCYSGIATKGTKGGAEADTKAAVDKFLKTVDEGLKEKSITGQGKMILASCDKDEESREIFLPHRNTPETHHHGAFTFHLLEALAGQARDERNMITLKGLKEYVDGKLLEKGTQKPMSSTVQLSGEGYVRIAVASDEFNRQYREFITEIETAYRRSDEEKDPGLLLGGIQSLNDILIEMPTDPQAIDLKNKIAGKLEDLKAKASLWLANNMREHRNKVRDIWDDLTRIVCTSGVDPLDQILKLDNVQYSLICYLFEATIAKIQAREFIDRCARVNSPRSASGLTAGKTG